MRRKWWSGGRGRDRNRRFPQRDHGTRSVGSRRPKEWFLIFFFCVSCILRWLSSSAQPFIFFLYYAQLFKKRITENNPECKQLKSGCLFLFKHSSLYVSFAGESNTCSWPIYIFWAQCSSPPNRMYLTLCRNAVLSHSVVSDSLSPHGL